MGESAAPPPVVENRTSGGGRTGNKKSRRWVAAVLIFGGVLVVCGGLLGGAGLFLKNMWDDWSREMATLPDVAGEDAVVGREQSSIERDSAVADEPVPSDDTAAEPSEQTFTAPNGYGGLTPIPHPDGGFRIATIGEKPALQAEDLYLYFDVHDDALYDLPPDGRNHFSLTATLFDDVKGSLDVQYDAHLATPDHDGRWTDTRSVELTGSGQWRTVTFDLPQARFANRQQGRADLRIRGHHGLTPVLHELVLQRTDSGVSGQPSPEHTSATVAGRDESEAPYGIDARPMPTGDDVLPHEVGTFQRVQFRRAGPSPGGPVYATYRNGASEVFVELGVADSPDDARDGLETALREIRAEDGSVVEDSSFGTKPGWLQATNPGLGAFMAWTRGRYYFSVHAQGGKADLDEFMKAFPY